MHHEKDVIFFRHGPGEPGPGPGGPWEGPGDFFTMRLPGPPGFRGFGRGMGRGRRIRRGDVRAAQASDWRIAVAFSRSRGGGTPRRSPPCACRD